MVSKLANFKVITNSAARDIIYLAVKIEVF